MQLDNPGANYLILLFIALELYLLTIFLVLLYRKLHSVLRCGTFIDSPKKLEPQKKTPSISDRKCILDMAIKWEALLEIFVYGSNAFLKEGHFSVKMWISIHFYQKLIGSTEPTEPMPTGPLNILKSELQIDGYNSWNFGLFETSWAPGIPWRMWMGWIQG